MRMKTEDFPMKTEMEVSLSSEELDHIKEEVTSTKEFEKCNQQSPHKFNFDASTSYHTK